MVMHYRILLFRGNKSQLNSEQLQLGEIAFATDTKELLVGNPKSEKGFDVVATVYEGPQNLLYAQLKNQDKLIPIAIKKYP